MLLSLNKPMGACLALAALLAGGFLAGPALADVEEGMDAWSRGDDAAAVRAWEVPAAAGDPDAMFNLAEAYRLGRGVATDPARAEALYARAAADGHLRAADTYGLMLFEQGRREEALPYLRTAARRGDPRAQYLLGIAHFNGDDVERDWQLAYAMMLLAGAAGLPQAVPALAEMDRAIPLAQRQQAASLAERMNAEAEAARKAELAAVPLTDPADAPIAADSDGRWRVQLGAFAVASNAEALWERLEGRAELAGAWRLMLPTGRVTRLQAGGFPSHAAAQAACAALKHSGYECLVTDR